VRIELGFSIPLKNSVNLIVYSENQRMLEIDKFRRVTIT